jgi:hypothetical protein
MVAFVSLAYIVLGAGGLAAAGAASEKPAGSTGLTVQVLIYSGRPDPIFVIRDSAGIGQLKQLLDQATPAAAPTDRGESVLPSILGYKGILVENPGGLGGLPRELAVYKQKVQARDGARRLFTDSGAIEGFLIEEAIKSKVLDDKAVELLRSARRGPGGKPQ